MDIRDAQRHDLPALVDLTIETFRPFFEHHLPARLDPTVLAHDHGRWADDYRQEVPALVDPEHGRFVTLAEDDGRILGYVGWNVTDGHSGRLQMVAVHPDKQRLGVGSSLCRTVLARLRGQGVAVVHVGTGGDEFHAPARGLYESLGFAAYPVVDYSLVLSSMTASAALGLYLLLDASGVRCWVMGGWGVDALLGRQTRSHHDLDLLVHREDLANYDAAVRSVGFVRSFEWEENRRVLVGSEEHDSAFVDSHHDGRQVDVHVVDVDTAAGVVTQHHAGAWPMPLGALSGRGRIAGTEVRCVTATAQVAMHTGYDLPERHRADLALLRREVTDA